MTVLLQMFDPSRYEFNILALQTAFVALTAFSLGVFILGRELDSRLRTTFFLLTTLVSFWLFAFSRMYAAVDGQVALFWAKAAYLGIAFIPAVDYTFSAIVLRDLDRNRVRIAVVWSLGAAFGLQIALTDTVFASLYQYSWGYYPRYRIASIPFLLYCIGTILYVLLRLFRTSRGMARTSPLSKHRRPVAMAFAGGAIAVIDFAPACGLDVYPTGYLFIFFFVIMSVYLMSQRRFPDIIPGAVASQVIDTMQDAVIVLDRDRIVCLVNDAACKLFGRDRNGLVGKRITESVAGNGGLSASFESALSSGATRDRTMVYQDPDGSERTISLSAAIIRDWTDAARFHVCVVHDITERVRTERALEQSNIELARQLNFTETLLKTEPVAVFFKDTLGRYLGCNEEFSKIVGISPEHIRGKTVFDLWPRELAAKYHEQDMALLGNPERQRYEFSVPAAQGGPIEVIFTKDVFTDERGAVQGIIGTFIDITDRKRAEAEIKSLNDDLEQRVRQRTSQLAQVNDALQEEITERIRTEESLREARRRLEHVVSTSPAVIYTCRYGGDWQATFVSDNLETMLGYPAQDNIRTRGFWIDHVHPDDRARVLNGLRNISGTDLYAHEYRLLHKDGRYLWVLDRFRVVRDGSGAPVECIGSWLDITDRRQTEDDLKTNRIFLHNIVNSIQDPIVVLDRNRNILLANKTFSDVFAVHRNADFLGRSCHEVLFGSHGACEVCLSAQSSVTGAVSHKVISTSEDGCAPKWYDVFAYPLFTTEGRVVGNVHHLRDITERKRAEETIAKDQEHLRSLAHQLLTSEERERKRIARELHDEMGQMLTGIKLSLQEIVRQTTPDVAFKVRDVQQDIGDLMVRMRDLSARLRPSMLDDLGLLPAVQWHIERFTKQTGMQVHFVHQGMDRELPPETSLTLFRILQEALTNAVRHSGADSAAITLMADERDASVTIQDRGAGFDPDEALSRGVTLGLAGMRERVEMTGGELTIRSARDRGTEIHCRLPIFSPQQSDQRGL